MNYIVYILQSEKDKTYYTGMTTDLEKRIKNHNLGISKYTASKKPYKLVWFKSGNMRLNEIKRYFEKNADEIIRLLEHHSFIILEKSKIRVLD